MENAATGQNTRHNQNSMKLQDKMRVWARNIPGCLEGVHPLSNLSSPARQVICGVDPGTYFCTPFQNLVASLGIALSPTKFWIGFCHKRDCVFLKPVQTKSKV